MNKKVLSSCILSTLLICNLSITQAESQNTTNLNANSQNTTVLSTNDKRIKNFEANKLLFINSQDDDTTLIFSDSPETVLNDGILYQDIVQGNNRLLYYHLNGTEYNKKIAVVIENLSNKTNTLTLTKQAVAGPSGDYLHVGKVTMQRYFTAQEPITRELKPHEKTFLYLNDNERIVPSGGLVYGIFDFTTSEKLKLSIIMASPNINLLDYVDYADILPKDKQRLRGTYTGKERYLTNYAPYDPTKSGKAYFYIGDNKTDIYKYGIDKTDNSITQNFGNYGIVYHIEPKLTGTGKTSFYLKPLGGVYAGAMSVQCNDEPITYKVINTPDVLPFFGHDKNLNYYSYLGTYNNNDKINFLYTPPGASNLPVEIILIPEKD